MYRLWKDTLKLCGKPIVHIRRYGLFWGSLVLIGLFIFVVVPFLSNVFQGWRWGLDSLQAGVLWTRGLSHITPNDFAKKQAQVVTEGEHCTFLWSEWDSGSGDGSLTLKDSNTVLYAMGSGLHSGTIRFGKSLSFDSETRFTFTPETSLINTVILYHDLFEVVVGDGDRRRVSLKINDGGKSMIPIDHIFLNDSIKSGNDVTVTIRQKPTSDGNLQLSIIVEYVREDGFSDDGFMFASFPVPHEFRNSLKPLRISIGFLNNSTHEEISAHFKCFKISKYSGGTEFSIGEVNEKF